MVPKEGSGPLAHLVERFHGMEEATGSIPVWSTKYICMIERFPQQPKKLDPIDRETLAILGYRIEMWDEARVSDATIGERKAALEAKVQQQIDSLEASDEEIAATELLELKDDLHDVHEFDGTAEEFAELCKERSDYYAAVRIEFLKTL